MPPKGKKNESKGNEAPSDEEPSTPLPSIALPTIFEYTSERQSLVTNKPLQLMTPVMDKKVLSAGKLKN